MAYTNSSLVCYTKLSPNHSGQRTHSIDRITPHCVVGQCSVETLGNIFYPSSRQASSNYGIGPDGRVGMYVEEKNRSWCSSSNANDQRAITIEVASDTTSPYAMKDAAYNTLVKLCVDICQRNGKKKLLWFADKDNTLNYSPAADEMVLSVHRWFANKSCPGDWLYNRLGELATTVTKALGGKEKVEPTAEFKVGDIVNFAGGMHYTSSNGSTGSQVKASKAKVTATYNGKHPYHVRAVNDSKAWTSGVYGWVDANTLSAIKTTTANTTTTTTTTSKKSNEEIAKEVMNGKWGNGDARKKKLTEAGYDYSAIQSIVNQMANGTYKSGSTTTTKPATATAATIKKGSKVKVKSGARTYTGGNLASFVYKTTYTVLELKGDRAVIGINGAVTAAMNIKDLTLL